MTETDRWARKLATSPEAEAYYRPVISFDAKGHWFQADARPPAGCLGGFLGYDQIIPMLVNAGHVPPDHEVVLIRMTDAGITFHMRKINVTPKEA